MTGLSVDDERALRALIDEERRQTEQRLVALNRDVEEIIESSDLSAADDEHDPDGQTIAYERAKATALRRQAEVTLAELDAAAARLDAGTFGTCVSCGGTIGIARLTARPTSSTCVGCASAGA